jgi:hypothetical protein
MKLPTSRMRPPASRRRGDGRDGLVGEFHRDFFPGSAMPPDRHQHTLLQDGVVGEQGCKVTLPVAA